MVYSNVITDVETLYLETIELGKNFKNVGDIFNFYKFQAFKKNQKLSKISLQSHYI